MKAEILAEQVLEWRVMHVDRVPVRKVDANGTKGIEIAGILFELIVGGFFGIPVDLLRWQLMTVAIKYADAIFGEIDGFLLHFRNQIPPHNGYWNGTERVE